MRGVAEEAPKPKSLRRNSSASNVAVIRATWRQPVRTTNQAKRARRELADLAEAGARLVAGADELEEHLHRLHADGGSKIGTSTLLGVIGPMRRSWSWYCPADAMTSRSTPASTFRLKVPIRTLVIVSRVGAEAGPVARPHALEHLDGEEAEADLFRGSANLVDVIEEVVAEGHQ